MDSKSRPSTFCPPSIPWKLRSHIKTDKLASTGIFPARYWSRRYRSTYIFRRETGPQNSSGARDLLDQQQKLPKNERYVRAVESVSLPGQKEFHVIICMLPAMSKLLMTTSRPTIDTSFKRADGYEEFEIEAWFPDVMKCTSCTTLFVAHYKHTHLVLAVVCARVFVTSQSAPAHLFMFKLVFKIAEEDTGRPIQFRHIHGTGFETFVADAHKGQALGQFCLLSSD
jgi:hypothetical protein